MRHAGLESGMGLRIRDVRAMRARGRHGQRGATAVEFAIVLPLLLLVLFAIVEFGFALYDKQLITTATGNAARAAVAYVGNSPAPTHPTIASVCSVATNSSNTVLSLMSSSAPVITVADTTSGTSTTCPSTSTTAVCGQGETINVLISYTFVGLLLGSSLNPLASTGGHSAALTASTTAQCM